MQTSINHRLRRLGHGLFGSWLNAALTVVSVYLFVIVIPPLIDWAILSSKWLPIDPKTCVQEDGACWAFIQAKTRFILFGRFPYEEQWRALLACVLVLFALGISGVWKFWHWQHWRRFLIGLWASVLVLSAILLHGGILGLSTVRIGLWGGLPVTLILSLFGIFFAFLFSIFLALGRRSELPIVRWVSVGYIELIRGVPLVGILFMAAVLFPMFLPEQLPMSTLLRAQIAFILFFAAYMAEVIRGGLQALDKGQYEAAAAIGLTRWQRMRWIILPQALTTTIPSLVNIFIGAFKDTSLVVIISMHDLLGTTKASMNDPHWLGVYIEPYLFTAAIYFVFCAGISLYSQRLEKYLNIGNLNAQ